jgi:hypothetical protein
MPKTINKMEVTIMIWMPRSLKKLITYGTAILEIYAMPAISAIAVARMSIPNSSLYSSRIKQYA